MKHSGLFLSAALAAALLPFTPLAAQEDTSFNAPPPTEEAVAEPGDESSVRIARETENETGTIAVNSALPKTEVYLDAVYQGFTPIVIGPLAPGLYRVYLRKSGYYPKSYLVRITRGLEIEIDADLRKITGTLEITGAPANAQYVIDGTLCRESIIELSEGIHSVEMRAFGYIAARRSVSIERRKRTVIDGTLERAAFDARDFKTAKGSFNPDNPANLGTLGISFSVTAPGAGIVRIYGDDGSLVRTLETPPFDTWEQNLRWDGRDETGAALPDGSYRLILEASGSGVYAGEYSVPLASETSAAIDRSISYPFTGSNLGAGSTGRVLSGSLLPASGTLVLFDVRGEEGSFCPALSVMYGLGGTWEAGLRAGVAVSRDDRDIDLAAALKRRIAAGAVNAAIFARWETGTGFAAGLASDLRAGILRLGAATDIRFGNSDGFIDADSFPSVSAGLSARAISGGFMYGIWGLAESGAFGRRFAEEGCLSGGLVAQWLAPRTNLLFIGEAGAERDFAESEEASPGVACFFRAGFGILF